MIQAHLNEDERLAIKTFAKWFCDGGSNEACTRAAVMSYFDWSESRFHVVLHRLESLGLVRDTSTSGNEYFAFAINSSVRDAATAIEDEEKQAAAMEPPDVIKGILRRARSAPLLSWTIVVVLSLAVLLTIINGTFELVNHIAMLFK